MAGWFSVAPHLHTYTSCHATRVYTLRHRYKAARGVLFGIWEADVAYVINQHVEKGTRDSRILTYSSLPRRRRAVVCPQKRPKPTMSEQQEEITVTDSHAYTIKGKHLEKDGIEGKT